MDKGNKPVGRFDKTAEVKVDREKIEKVISGSAKVRQNHVRKLTNTFFAEDMSTVKSHLKDDVLIPELKRLAVNLLKDGVDILFNGRVTRNNKTNGFISDRIAYDRFSTSKPSTPVSVAYRFNYDDLEFETRADAQAVLDLMRQTITRYGFVTVSEMYDTVGKTAPFTANNYGWIDISNADVDRVYGGGYVIRLPRAMPLER